MDYKNYYEALGVGDEAGEDDIKRAYRKLARKYHPDVNPGDREAEERYREITEARAVLTDPDRRAKYDQLYADWQAHQIEAEAGPFDWSRWMNGVSREVTNGSSNEARSGEFSDFFETIFRHVGEEVDDTVRRDGQDYHQKLEISLEEAFTGTARVLQVGKRKIEVRIPRGAASGTKIRVRGEGAEGLNGGSKGDLYLEIVLAPHELFERVGDDLHVDLPVDLYTAILGGEAVVSTFKGRIKLKIPPETQSGRGFRLKGQGMPRLQQPDERGDLFAKVVVQLPQDLSPEEIALFEELADIRGL